MVDIDYYKTVVETQHDWEIFREEMKDLIKELEQEREESIQVQAKVKPEIADTTKITMWVDMIWNDIFDDDELPLTAKQMNIIGKYINDAKEKIRKQFSV